MYRVACSVFRALLERKAQLMPTRCNRGCVMCCYAARGGRRAATVGILGDFGRAGA
jgi:hypothetical protein